MIKTSKRQKKSSHPNSSKDKHENGIEYSSVLAVSTLYAAESGPSEVDRVKNGVMDLIRDRQILPGQRLDQRRLAKLLSSSTAPLREALSSLEAEHVLVRERGLGVFCRSYTVTEVEEMIEIRGVLEGLAARLAVGHYTTEAGAELTRLACELEKPIPPKGEERFVEVHLSFHKRIIALSQSSMLKLLADRHYFVETVLRNIAPLLWTQEPHDHQRIVKAIASGDPERAEHVMRQHIGPTYTERLAKLRIQYGNGHILPVRGSR